MAAIACVLLAAPATAETSPQPHANRLIQSASPYLLQHAHNPVDWYPWGDEALAKAKTENKPIFLVMPGQSAGHPRILPMQHIKIVDGRAFARRSDGWHPR